MAYSSKFINKIYIIKKGLLSPCQPLKQCRTNTDTHTQRKRVLYVNMELKGKKKKEILIIRKDTFLISLLIYALACRDNHKQKIYDFFCLFRESMKLTQYTPPYLCYLYIRIGFFFLKLI